MREDEYKSFIEIFNLIKESNPAVLENFDAKLIDALKEILSTSNIISGENKVEVRRSVTVKKREQNQNMAFTLPYTTTHNGNQASQNNHMMSE